MSEIPEITLEPQVYLNMVGDLIEKHGMLCKADWSMIRTLVEGEDLGFDVGKDDSRPSAKRLGCAEGLLAEVMGFYDGFQKSFIAVNKGGDIQFLGFGEVLNFNAYDEEGDEMENWYIDRLRETDAWKILAKTIRESGFFINETVPPEHIVIAYNDDDDTTEEDVLLTFRKAAIEAPNFVGSE